MRSKADLTAAIRDGGPAVLVINARARTGEALLQHAPRRLAEQGVAVARVINVRRPGRLPQALDEAVAEKPDLLIAAGGDGTLSTAGKRVADLDLALGVLPVGTTNNFARSIGWSGDLDGAIATLGSGKVADVDLGQAGPDAFTNMVSLGVSVQVAGRVPHRLKRHLGRTAYPLTALAALPGHRPFRARITAGDTELEFETHQLNIANGAFHGGRRIARDADIDDRLLLAYRFGAASRLHLVGSAVRHALTGSYLSMEDEPFLTAGDLRLETDPVLPLDVDGEIRGSTPVHIRVRPNALRVMVPQDFTDR
ncbi:diacylglycerol/lipid kinase family protein [Actinoallomurus soli]|uniref:diacylglycerol/lipid kinase family protein n=1 Tax=Actinoallomurus soli TaxID=2952535 RepID=UPI0020931A57|nr:YegS/Rv2252/BmrU family lipid kinase [Actinoallomurus soli]MCO5971700.1 YegS/Rv2252/BmrU family lipid kinase [Actinoallomurus soli]